MARAKFRCDRRYKANAVARGAAPSFLISTGINFRDIILGEIVTPVDVSYNDESAIVQFENPGLQQMLNISGYDSWWWGRNAFDIVRGKAR